MSRIFLDRNGQAEATHKLKVFVPDSAYHNLKKQARARSKRVGFYCSDVLIDQSKKEVANQNEQYPRL